MSSRRIPRPPRPHHPTWPDDHPALILVWPAGLAHNLPVQIRDLQAAYEIDPMLMSSDVRHFVLCVCRRCCTVGVRCCDNTCSACCRETVSEDEERVLTRIKTWLRTRMDPEIALPEGL